MKRLSSTGLGLLLCVVACSSGTSDRAPGFFFGGASADAGVPGRSGGGSAGHASDQAGSAGDAAASGEANDGGDAGDGGGGGEAGLEQGMVVPITPSTCSDSAVWAEGVAVPGVSSAANEKLLSISADELDILFMRDQDVLLAHREGARDPFADPTLLSIPAGYDASAGATLSSDGKTLILVSSDGQSLGSLSRGSRTDAFDTTADVSAFELLNQLAAQILQHYAAPVLAPNGKTLIFTAFIPEPEQGFPPGFEGTASVHESPWSSDHWERPENISQYLFDGTTLARPLPTGLSADSRTLFYLDEATSKELARFRDRPDAPFATLLDLGQRVGAIPNSACDTLYYFDNGDVLSASN